MAGRWDDTHIAASLNRMGLQTGQGKSWNAKRVGEIRRVHDIHAFRSAEKNGEWLTMREAAKELGVTSHVIRRLIQSQVLAAEQVVPGAPFQIKLSDLRGERIAVAIRRKAAPYRAEVQTELQMFPIT
jgi:excisionase family DNA binding protein